MIPYLNLTPNQVYNYALNVIKGRFTEAESVITQHHYWAYLYACHIIKGRFLEAEPVIKNSAWEDGYNQLMEKSRIDFRL